MLIVHLSDPHLRPQGQLYQGLVDSNAMFEAALRQLEALVPQPDLVLISGDLVDEGQPDEYETALKLLARIRAPLLVIPGNHDEREAFRHAFRAQPYIAPSGPLHAVAACGPLRILGLDVTVPGEHHGEMDEACCAWLEAQLAAESERPTIIMMHQPPVASGIGYIDDYNCRQGERLAAIVARHANVERVLCGHIHRFMQMRFAGTMLLTAPSTTTAIALRLAEKAEPASFVEPPAMLLHHWVEGRGLTTHFLPIGVFPGPLPFF